MRRRDQHASSLCNPFACLHLRTYVLDVRGRDVALRLIVTEGRANRRNGIGTQIYYVCLKESSEADALFSRGKTIIQKGATQSIAVLGGTVATATGIVWSFFGSKSHDPQIVDSEIVAHK
ncbi:hypothetical protein Tcan_18352 [Toxocara canis]|uniref:Uncharacterized protein n=1 Tax=Toxocara canis TaxID=6265 RepID=A0A0B2UWK1_TOXCA|nr:hypothetical protein Tcan_18352 [Toxocara canis]